MQPKSLHVALELFQNCKSGQGNGRISSLAHDTKKALVQTTEGLIATCNYLFSQGFVYVSLRHIQSDMMER